MGEVLHDLYKAGYRVPKPATGDTIYVSKQDTCVPVTTGSGAFALTLARPLKDNIRCVVLLDTDGGGDLTLTVTGGYNADAATSIVFGDAGDFVQFVSIKCGSTFYWRVVGHEGTTVAVEDFTTDQLTALTLSVTTGATMTDAKVRRVVASVTAVGSVQSLATNTLVEGLNVVTGGGNNLGLLLPVAAAGAEIIVKNNSGSTVIVYGSATADIINALATTTGFSVATTKTMRFIRENSTQWWTDPLAVA